MWLTEYATLPICPICSTISRACITLCVHCECLDLHVAFLLCTGRKTLLPRVTHTCNPAAAAD